MQVLQMALFSIIDIFENMDDKLYVFEQVHADIMDGQAFILWMSTPLLNRLLSEGNQVSYVTEQWRKAIRHHNKLW